MNRQFISFASEGYYNRQKSTLKAETLNSGQIVMAHADTREQLLVKPFSDANRSLFKWNEAVAEIRISLPLRVVDKELKTAFATVLLKGRPL